MALPDRKPLLGEGVPESLRVCQTATGADVSCARPHAFRVEAVYAAPGGAYPDPNRYTAAARTRCKELMGKDGGYWQPPSEAGWKAGDRYIRCLSRTCVLRTALRQSPRFPRDHGKLLRVARAVVPVLASTPAGVALACSRPTGSAA